MNRRSIEAGRGHVVIGLKNRIKRGARGLQKDLDSIGKRMRGIGAIGMATGAALALPIGIATKNYADFDDQMRQVGAVSQSNDHQLKKLTQTAKELGRTTSFTAGEVAALMVELGRAGFDPSQIDAMTGSVLSLARATGTEAPIAAGVMSASIRQFNLNATEAARVADSFTAAANGSFNTVEGLAESMTYAGPVAADMNMSLEETLAILGTLGNVGIQGSAAGTAVRRLLTLSGAEAERMSQIFGVSFLDATGNTRPLVDSLSDVAAATNGLGTAARMEKFNAAFGLLGITGASAISKTATETKQLLQTLEQSAGTADKTAKEMDDGIGGSFRKIISAAEGVQIAVGESIEKPVQQVTMILTDLLGRTTTFIEENRELVQIVAAGTAGLLAGGTALVAFGTAATVASLAIGGIASAAAMIVSPIGLGVAAISGLGFAFVKYTAIGGEAMEWLKDKLGKLVGDVSQSIDGIKAAIANGDLDAAWEIAVGTIELVWLEMTDQIRDSWTKVVASVLDVSASMTEQIGLMFQGLGDFLEGLLDKYKSYYDQIFNFVTEKAGELNGVRTIGDPSGSAFESSLGASEQAMRDRLATVREFGSQLQQQSKYSKKENAENARREIAERERRIFDLRKQLAIATHAEIGESSTRKRKESISNVISELLENLFSGQEQQPGLADISSSAGQNTTEPNALTTTNPQGTFSGFAAMLSGLGAVDSPTEQTAKNTAKTNQMLGGILETLSKWANGQAQQDIEGVLDAPGEFIAKAFDKALDFTILPVSLGMNDEGKRENSLPNVLDTNSAELKVDNADVVGKLSEIYDELRRPKPVTLG